MAILRPDTTTTLNGVKINEYLLTKHNPNHINMPSVSMESKLSVLLFTTPTGFLLQAERHLRSSTQEQPSMAT